MCQPRYEKCNASRSATRQVLDALPHSLEDNYVSNSWTLQSRWETPHTKLQEFFARDPSIPVEHLLHVKKPCDLISKSRACDDLPFTSGHLWGISLPTLGNAQTDREALHYEWTERQPLEAATSNTLTETSNSPDAGRTLI